MELTLNELDIRRSRFIQAMNTENPDWDTALIISKVNQYYFTGSMQDALLIIKKDGSYSYNIKRSFERALDESPLKNIYPMNSYREIAQKEEAPLGVTYLETDILPYSLVERLKEIFDIKAPCSLDNVLKRVRAVKSPYELYWMEVSGRQHDRLLTETLPSLLREGMSEAELVGELSNQMYLHGFQGLTRFSRFQTEMSVGQLGFGTSSLYPTNFDGPGGARGNSAAVPLAGDPMRKLKIGDLVFVDIGFGINGYHTDKTQVYMFGAKPSSEITQAHQLCLEVETRTAERLRPGEIPSKIYNDIMASLTENSKINFMGFMDRTVKFLGHGIGLHIDELPVLAEGFNEPLLENMVISLEPKKGVADAGMVGTENTYIVTPGGGRCITGGTRDIIIV